MGMDVFPFLSCPVFDMVRIVPQFCQNAIQHILNNISVSTWSREDPMAQTELTGLLVKGIASVGRQNIVPNVDIAG
jgi:hypothetical protein